MSGFNPAVSVVLLSTLLCTLFIMLYLRLRSQTRKRLRDQLKQLLLLRRLLGEFQRHRGLSNGLLNGDNGLRNELGQTRRQLSDIEQQAGTLMPTLPGRWQALIAQWHKVRQDSESDQDQNLSNHHRLIRNTLFLFEDIACDMDLSRLDQQQQQTLQIVWHEIPQTTEWIGQARALGTGIAARKSSTAEQRMRLRFLHQKIGQQSNAAFAVLGEAADPQLKQSVTAFLICLEQELLNRDIPEIDALHYFEQATGTINELLAMLDDTLQTLQKQHQLH